MQNLLHIRARVVQKPMLKRYYNGTYFTNLHLAIDKPNKKSYSTVYIKAYAWGRVAASLVNKLDKGDWASFTIQNYLKKSRYNQTFVSYNIVNYTPVYANPKAYLNQGSISGRVNKLHIVPSYALAQVETGDGHMINVKVRRKQPKAEFSKLNLGDSVNFYYSLKRIVIKRGKHAGYHVYNSVDQVL